jgi:3-phosphoshikimate 1-carboxyvinyltransferase
MEVMSSSLFIKKHTGKINCIITPPSSKSESNRVLIIDALTGGKCDLQNLSNARDTQTMIRLLKSGDYLLDVIDAGTTMRFLTAFCAVSGREAEMTGTERMCERPIKLLVDALRELGCSIEYKNKEGYPPLSIKKFDKNNIKTNHLKIRGDVSSQYITALLMVAPTLPKGMVLELEGKVGSKPYIEMTLALMKIFGVTAKTDWIKNTIEITPQHYIPSSYSVESDWSGASYWFSLAALAEESKIEIRGYKSDSLQGDRVIVAIAEKFGVKSTFTDKGLILEKTSIVKSFEWDFTHCPDLAQTVAVICAAKGIECTMTGLESLRIKETDRITAIQNELQKFGGDLIEVEKNHKFKVVSNGFSVKGQTVATYKDHRMAMAFAPLALLGDVTIEGPEEVAKSYPDYWADLKKAGFEINL